MKLALKGTPVLEANRRAVSDPTIKIIVNRGGTRSSKTYSIMQLLFIRLITGKLGNRHIPSWVCSIVRKYKVTLKGTVQRDFLEIWATMAPRAKIKENKTDKTYWYKGRLIEFIGADDEQKLRGGKRDILYCNEGNELAYTKEFYQLLVRTKHLALVDLNPSDPDVRVNTELEQKRAKIRGDVRIIVSTYLDNPFLTQAQVDEIEYTKNIDAELWKVYGLGEYGRVTGTVFDNWEVIGELPELASYLIDGLDFWFTNDPTALVRIYKWNKALVLDCPVYETWLTNVDVYNQDGERTSDRPSIDRRMLEAWLSRVYAEIIADSSEPKSIQELFDVWRDIKGAVKWPDSVNAGIDIMHRYKLLVTARSVGLISEMRKYKRKVDKDGKPTNKPIDKYNHAIDGARYGITYALWWFSADPDLYVGEIPPDNDGGGQGSAAGLDADIY